MAGVIKPYAEALFETAMENGNPDAVYSDVLKILGIFRGEPEFKAMLQNPRMPQADKESAVSKALAGADGSLCGLIILMLRKGRGEYIEATLGEFVRLAKDYKGIVTARVYSAVDLTEAQISAIKEQLAAKTGRQIEIEAYADPSLIGGLLIKAGGMVLDSTIKKHLRTLRKRLA